MSGTVVHEASLKISSAGATWDKVELLTASAPNDDNDYWGGNIDGSDLIVPAGPGRALLARLPRYAVDGFDSGIVAVDQEANVPAVGFGISPPDFVSPAAFQMEGGPANVSSIGAAVADLVGKGKKVINVTGLADPISNGAFAAPDGTRHASRTMSFSPAAS